MVDRPPPQLVYSRWGINIVSYAGWFWRVPQRLGTICLELDADRGHPEIVLVPSLAAAKDSIGWRDAVRYPPWRTWVFMRGWFWHLTGTTPKQKRCPSWDQPPK